MLALTSLPSGGSEGVESDILIWKHFDVIPILGAGSPYCRKTSSAGNASGNERETRVSEGRDGNWPGTRGK